MTHTQEVGRRGVYDWVLYALLAALLIGVLTFDRAEWKSMIGDESTYLMAAMSLAWDGDLLYERQDYDRFLEHWQRRPLGLILQSGDRGEHLAFGKPFFYPLWIAPFVRVWPMGGAFLANFVVLAIAALASTRTLRKSVGVLAPVWVACFVFGSVSFGYTFWAHADLFMLALVALAYALAFRTDDPAPSSRRLALRWATIGVLLAVVVFSRPVYLPLLAPPLFALPARKRWRTGAALVLGVAGLVLAAASVHKLTADSWTSYGAQRRGFGELTGFPGVDFPVEEWQSTLEYHGDAAWAEARSLFGLPPTTASLWLWNGLYFSLGRHIGILPYFLPLLLGLLGPPRGVARWMLLLAVLAAIGGFFLYRPFNIYGGGGALANRYFMPLFPAFWFMATGPCRPRRIVAVVLLAAPFLWPLWAAPRSYPLRANHTYRYVSPLAKELLPFETTQSHLKPAGRSDVVLNGLWIKMLTPSLRPKRDRTALLLNRGSQGTLLIGTYRPTTAVEFQTLGDPAEALRIVSGADLESDEETSRGRRLRVRLGRPRARHPMWWTWKVMYLYRVTLEAPSTEEGRLTFTLRPIADPARGDE